MYSFDDTVYNSDFIVKCNQMCIVNSFMNCLFDYCILLFRCEIPCIVSSSFPILLSYPIDNSYFGLLST